MTRSTAARPPAAGLLGIVASLAIGASFGGSSGCYSERAPPPTYRYQCDGDGDGACDDGEQCRMGICERTCTLATFADDCLPSHATCFNGACSNTCEVDAGVCPSAQECVDLSAFGVDVSGGSSSPFGGSTAMLGICGRICDADNDLCQDGETCVLGFCTATCDPTDEAPCSDGFACIAPGICAPDAGEGELGDTGDSTQGDGTAGGGSGSGDSG